MLRRTAPALLSLAACHRPALLSAQYFGRNKVQYTSFDFKVIQTEHFDIYFYERERVAAMDVARMAERSYARLSEGPEPRVHASGSRSSSTRRTRTSGRPTRPRSGRGHRGRHRLRPQPGRDAVHRARTRTSSTSSRTRWSTSSSTTSGPAAGRRAAWPRCRHRAAALVRGGHGGVPVDRADQRRRPRCGSATRSLEDKLPTIEQMTLDPYQYFPYRFGHALWSYIGGALGRRGGRRHPQGDAGRRH